MREKWEKKANKQTPLSQFIFARGGGYITCEPHRLLILALLVSERPWENKEPGVNTVRGTESVQTRRNMRAGPAFVQQLFVVFSFSESKKCSGCLSQNGFTLHFPNMCVCTCVQSRMSHAGYCTFCNTCILTSKHQVKQATRKSGFPKPDYQPVS